MIKETELRLGNWVLQKTGARIQKVKVGWEQFERLSNGEADQFYPIVLAPEILEKCGFVENKAYPLLPDAHKFILTMPVMGSNKNELYVYVKNNKESFGRAAVNGLVASANFYYLHQLQNLYFALNGIELEFKITI